jgi:metal-responsive CopG/Arc/MetJ family transcriptional regulator
MKTITVNVSEATYESFQDFARRSERKTSELIREAMAEYAVRHIQRRTSLRARRPASVGGAISSLGPDDDLLGEMLDASRD